MVGLTSLPAPLSGLIFDQRGRIASGVSGKGGRSGRNRASQDVADAEGGSGEVTQDQRLRCDFGRNGRKGRSFPARAYERGLRGRRGEKAAHMRRSKTCVLCVRCVLRLRYLLFNSMPWLVSAVSRSTDYCVLSSFHYVLCVLTKINETQEQVAE